MPTAAVALRTLGRTLRLRCPNCGDGFVLKRTGSIRPRCSACNFRFERSDDNYFSGAMFFGLLAGEFTFGLILLAIIVAKWPNVPWDAMTYGIPAGVLLVMLFLIPVSKVIWLAFDVMVRPVVAEEMI
ncbi:MAG TPA: DUF983 domain-containing protein [Gemmatimonadaceae bacterium]|nr:DUF983 domain-containing protein [Gemmatimonadaceae bacterium]